MLRTATMLAVLLAFGCRATKEPSAPPGPVGSPAGVPIPGRSTRGDDSTKPDESDAGVRADAAMGPTTPTPQYICLELSDEGLASAQTVLTLPRALEVTHAYVAMAGDCAAPRVEVGFADACDPESGAIRAAISVDIEAYLTGLLVPGANAVGTGIEGLTVALERPDAAGVPRTFGSCGGASGSVNINQLLLEGDPRIAITFDVEALPCDEDGGASELMLGVVEMALPTTLSSYCPDFVVP